MVEDHKEDIRLFEAQAKSSKGPVPDYARDTLPDLKKHLQTAQSLQNKFTAGK